MLNLVDALERVIVAIQKLEQKPMVDTGVIFEAFDREKVVKQIEELDIALEGGEAPDQIIKAILAQLNGHTSSDKTESLTYALDNFEFDTARSILANITDEIRAVTE